MAYEGAREAWIVEAVRTPIGRYSGALSAVRPDDLGALITQVAWWRHSVADDCTAELARVMDRSLGFEQPPGKEDARVEETVET